MKHSVCVSIVSHNHGAMVEKLVIKLLEFKVVTKIILTINVPEDIYIKPNNRVKIKINSSPKGFGENHNAAFLEATTDFFCVMNPDIVLLNEIFSELFSGFTDSSVGVVAPLVVDAKGSVEDSMRSFLTPLSMVKRIFGIDSGVYPLHTNVSWLAPDWVAGMCMLFSSSAFSKVGGFDSKYFMYCEDADICTRLWKMGYKVVGCLTTRVIHNAQRASHRSFKHLLWHLRSLTRYFFSHSFSLPPKHIA